MGLACYTNISAPNRHIHLTHLMLSTPILLNYVGHIPLLPESFTPDPNITT